MKFYFAGWEKDCYNLFQSYGIDRRLISYWKMMKGQKFDRPKDFFLDSGAFSAFTQGQSINIDNYIEFIKQHKPETYAVLDVIGDFEKTKANQKYMESKGVNPLPTVHFGSSKEQINYWLDGYNHIAIGGLVPHAKFRKRLFGWTDIFFSQVREKFPVKCHAFGMASNSFLTRYPCYSSDSTSWQRFSKFGNSSVEMCENKRIFLTKSKTVPPKNRYAIEMEHHLRLERFITELWKKKGIIWE